MRSIPSHLPTALAAAAQVVKAMAEAERYDGVSLVIAYSPCVMHGISGGMCHALEDTKEAVETVRG